MTFEGVELFREGHSNANKEIEEEEDYIFALSPQTVNKNVIDRTSSLYNETANILSS